MDTRLKSVLVVLTAAIICTFSNFYASAQGTGTSLNPDIASLESRFFDHTYPQEPMETRLDRLERMVFGEQKTGSDQARLTALLLAVPAEPAASSTAQTPDPGTVQADASSDTPSTQPGTEANQSDESSNAAGAPPGDVTNSSDYPRITQLEQEILGKTFTKEPIQNRLEQLELKAFGKPTTDSDLADRTEALEDYADKHFPQQQHNYAETADGGYQPAATQYPQYQQSSQQPEYNDPAVSSVNSIAPNATLDQKVTWLEQQVLGTTYPTQPLLDRVNKLAINIFPADSPQRTQSLADQVSSMIGAVELMPKRGSASVAQATQYNQAPQYSPPPFSQYPQTQQYGSTPNFPAQSTALAGTPTSPATSAPSHGHSFMHGLAHVLGTVGQMAAGQAGGMMMGGMGGGGYGMPFGL
ncbi:hypothetical protein BH10CYA1_BH10CYA1_08280 [soil metagenome]